MTMHASEEILKATIDTVCEARGIHVVDLLVNDAYEIDLVMTAAVAHAVGSTTAHIGKVFGWSSGQVERIIEEVCAVDGADEFVFTLANCVRDRLGNDQAKVGTVSGRYCTTCGEQIDEDERR